MSRRTFMTLRVMLLLLVSLGFNQASCDLSPPSQCGLVSISLEPGTCVEVQNPCGDNWQLEDGFALGDAPPGLFIKTVIFTEAERLLCAETSVGQLVGEPVDYFYTRPGEQGIGQFLVTVGATPLAVTASANPTSIPSGATSQLNAMVSGGLAPYFFSWSGAGLSGATGASPTVSPNVTTQYTVVVTDSIGHTANAAVIVNVGVAATATATPLTINPGQSSQLTVQASGGTPPYTFAWTPAATLNDPTLPNPLAMPTLRTTYDVEVTDFLGATAYSSVTVQVASTGADLFVTKVDSLDPLPAGRLFTYTVTVTNNGPASATGVTLADTLPTGLTVISIVTSQGTFSQSGDIITCNLGPVAGGATATLTINARRFTPVPITMTNTATVTANESDPNSANNTASEITSVIPQ